MEEYSNFTIGKPRCNIPERLIAFGCPSFAIKEATTGSVQLLQDENFQDVIIDQIPVQLKPQKIRIKLRPLSEEILRIQYRPAKNYPLDLYYLMDLTWSMQDDKETLVGLGWKMANTLGTFTNNFRLGFGSYADKPLMPYIFPGYEDNPCQAEHATCAPLYSFRHHMTLSGDVQEFIKKVNASDVTGNVDNLEGGLDGVVQAVVCGEQVGWGHQARKLMLVATDGSLHFAGDGKLGGVVHRQDFMCYLNSDGEYSMATEFDYPSLAEISRLLQSHKVNLIFAIGEDHREEYENIAELLKEKAHVATLTGNSSNILEIVEQAYHEIVSKVILRDNSTGSFNVEYFSNCGVQDGPQMPTSECNGLLEGHVYNFDVKFSLKECPANESLWVRIYNVSEVRQIFYNAHI
ncbi:integrin beta-nu isoform X2 [Cephus cinctus]|uniref:Integrin beta n=1 Tax=Cephus cinctus TaxID=211228 RepID=A0AAJ7C458_CEPCN|nr:integrin beta-nu isoform X2 [Cephus cinctus]